MERVYNFSAGPSMMPVEILQQAKEDLISYPGAGCSAMEMSHRSAAFEKIIADDGNTLHFHFSDGTVVTRTWADRSRAESWTPEMKEKARQQSLARRRQKA